ncbi:MAG TPA: dUTP diphosphatase [Bacteroidales bacterium]|jgi:dUTP pyrophosphatase|nr:dUTP diphosphatase [Bacteroidales bacterium]HQA86925.1 dUTP diphosphatase [Bacteroidales bacterium]
MLVKIHNFSEHNLPEYSSASAAGLDLRANTKEQLTINPGERVVVPTGLIIEIPNGYEGQIRPRSGLAASYGITVLNSPGTVDADYRGEVKVILINLSDKPFVINNGDRIAQLVIAKFEKIEWEAVDATSLSVSKRGEQGFGSTGKK